MPRVTVWIRVEQYDTWRKMVKANKAPELISLAIELHDSIRKDDEAIWKAIKNKPEFIHKVLTEAKNV